MRKYSESWYSSFEQGVREVVRAFHDVGVDTDMSCEGHIRNRGGLFPKYLYVEFPPGTYRKNEKEFKRLIRGKPGHTCHEGSFRWINDCYVDNKGIDEKLREFFVYQTFQWTKEEKLKQSKVWAEHIHKAWNKG